MNLVFRLTVTEVNHRRTGDPTGFGTIQGRSPWVAGTRTVPLPTATQFQPLEVATPTTEKESHSHEPGED